jgi:phosphopantetheinyl transferase
MSAYSGIPRLLIPSEVCCGGQLYGPSQEWSQVLPYSQYRKPTLVRESSGDTLNFNVAHSNEWALYAITHD